MEKTLREMLEELDERMNNIEERKNAPKQSFGDKLLGKKKVEKEFKVPKEMKRGEKKKIKDNYCVVIYIYDNMHMDISWCPIVDDCVYVKQTDLYYTAVGKCICQYKKYPVLVIAEWNINPITKKPEPFDPSKDIKKIEAGTETSAYSQKILIHLLKKQALAIKDKKKMGGKTILIAIVVIGVIIYIATKLIK